MVLLHRPLVAEPGHRAARRRPLTPEQVKCETRNPYMSAKLSRPFRTASIGGRILLFGPLQSPSFRPDPQYLNAVARRAGQGWPSRCPCHARRISRPLLDRSEHDGRLRRVGIALAARLSSRYRAHAAIRRAPDRYQTPLDFRGSPSCEALSAGPAPMSMGSCDDRITLYPAAPLRLATLLHARTIAREGWGSSSQRQIGEAKSAMGFASHASDPPNAPPKGASEPLACHLAFPVVGGLRIAPCGTMPCST